MRLLVTRPHPDGERTAATLRARGHAALLAPLLCIEPLGGELPDGPLSAVVMTSANAARALSAHPARARLLALPAFTTGMQSAQAARAAGFADVHCASGDKRDLARLVASKLSGARSPLLYLAGTDRAGELDLAVPVLTVEVYRAVLADRFAPEVSEAMARGELDGVVHFSRRTAQAFVDCAGRAGLRVRALALVHFCLSAQVAAPLAAAGAAAIRIAARPDEAALLALVANGAAC